MLEEEDTTKRNPHLGKSEQRGRRMLDSGREGGADRKSVIDKATRRKRQRESREKLRT